MDSSYLYVKLTDMIYEKTILKKTFILMEQVKTANGILRD